MGDVLFSPPPLGDVDLRVLAGIDAHRRRLSLYLALPRRWRGQLRRNLFARARRGSNSIEGCDVSLDDALAILSDDEESLEADRNTVLEVTGYRNAMTYVQQLAGDPHFVLDQSLLRGLHFMMLGHDLSKSPGSYRRGTVYVKDEDRDEVVYESPDADLVPDLMAELVGTVGADPDQEVFVTAAMAHLNLVMIHPFRDGNGRMARALQTLLLARNQVLAPEFSSIEEWLGRNTTAYYDILSLTGRGRWSPTRDTLAWVRFNLRAHHMQAQTVWARVQESDDLWDRVERLVGESGLPPRGVGALVSAAQGLRIRRTAYQMDAQVEPATATRDLRTLTAAGLLVPRGETRGRFYVGSESLRAHAVEVRGRHRGRIVDPYDSLADLPGKVLDPVDGRLF